MASAPAYQVPEDPKARLEFETAVIRQATCDGGMRVDCRGGWAFTPDLKGLVGRGLLAVKRPERGGNLANRLFATPRGVARLAGIEERYGDGFGPVHAIGPVLKNNPPRR